jgi:16S rRNA (uracil1498-N3)-methyltransferase
MRRFFVNPKDLKPDHEVILEGDEFHHLKVISRLESGEKVELLDGSGHIAQAEILSIGKKNAVLKVLKIDLVPEAAKPVIDLYLCVPRFQKMDLIIQKCVELGVETLTPLVSDRSFLKTVSKDLLGKLPRWEKIILEACKQSGRPRVMALKEPMTLEKALTQLDPKTTLFPYEGEGVAINEMLSAMSKPNRVAILVGAEGGFSPTEVQLCLQKGLKPSTLGPLVLRVETACITLVSVIQYHFGLMR